jgi:hypothetical protein
VSAPGWVRYFPVFTRFTGLKESGVAHSLNLQKLRWF